MMRALPWTAVAFIIGGLVSMGMPGLSGFVAEFPIFLGVWRGGTTALGGTFLGLDPSVYYPILAIISVLGIIITAAYILRAIGTVFFGEYEGDRWHDMRELLAIDKVTLLGFAVILILIGVVPAVISPIVEAGVAPVVERLQEAQQGFTVYDTVHNVVRSLAHWLGGA
jgi:NADH-quinone oxidoreductase subunit M